MATYRVRLSNPTTFFFDHEAKVFLDYYNPDGATQLLTDRISKAVESGTLVDLVGNITSAPVEEVAEETVEEVKETVEIAKEVVEELADEVEEDSIDISGMTKKEMLSFISDNGFDIEEIGITKSSNAGDIREALSAYLKKNQK